MNIAQRVTSYCSQILSREVFSLVFCVKIRE